MVDCYGRMISLTPDTGFQVVMFTDQDVSVRSNLALILWSGELRVTAAWCIATETESALKEVNYVQGAVLLVLRKQTGAESAFLDEVYQEVEAEVLRHRGQRLCLQPTARYRNPRVPGRLTPKRLLAALAERRRSR